MPDPTMKIEDIEHELIHPAKDNPNEMDTATMKALRSDIENNGFVQPVLVRPDPEGEGTYEIVDGEHRWRVLGEMGLASVPCVVTEADDTDAAIRRITMNRLRGQFVPVRLAHLLADLNQRIPEDEIRRRLAMEGKELRNYLALDSFLEEGDPQPPPKPPGEKEPDDRQDMVFVCTREQAQRADRLLEALTDGDDEQVAPVLAKQARAYNATIEG